MQTRVLLALAASCLLASVLLSSAHALPLTHGSLLGNVAIDSLEQRMVLRIMPTSARERELVESLTSDVWSASESYEAPFDAVFTREVCDKLIAQNIAVEIMIEDLDSLIHQQAKERSLRQHDSQASYYDDYHPLSEINEYLAALQASNADISTLFSLGNKTHEGRTLVGIKISTGNRNNKSVWFHGGQHAREWISPSTVMYVTEQILREIRTTPSLSAIDWYILPVMNADGYEYTWTKDRMWRKNRRNNGNSYGVDLNRNWDYNFGGAGSSGTPASDTYRGPFAFSEPESDAIARFIATIPNLRVFIDWHSYSQYILRPWAALADDPVDEVPMRTLGDGMKAAMLRETGADYTSMHWYQMYFASGVCTDYVYNLYRAYSYCIELRDKGRYGFVLPPDQILPTGRESYAAVKYMADFLAASH
eukprot:TRINITY_DN14445_c0_g1_i1.p1 TRINITY_DN14445_c0_g1~~TRINITY_DN14445_c0_g1_i1.p1  ORF type:complete len:422 (-),score=68.61 TRINITY_DN14445_c0_g1_i1:78-1343(-)